MRKAIANAEAKRGILCDGSPHQKIEILAALIDRMDLHEDRIDLTVTPARLRELLQLPAEPASSESLILSLPVVKVRRGHQLRLVIPGPKVIPMRQRDEKLVSLIAEAHQARKLLFAHPGKSLSAIASAHGRCRTRLGKLITLSCMAPDIIQAVLEGRQPASLTARHCSAPSCRSHGMTNGRCSGSASSVSSRGHQDGRRPGALFCHQGLVLI